MSLKQLINRYIKAISICIILLVHIEAQAAPEIIAHRCGAKELPENTLFALKVLENTGIKYVEIDVQITKDKIPILYHSDNLVKLNLSGQIKDYHYKKLAKTFWIDERFPGNKLIIPTLEEVLVQFPQIHFIIDFKSVPHEPLVNAVIKIVNQYKAWDRLLFYSTDNLHLQILRQKAPQAVTFENRSDTRTRLLNIISSHKCTIPSLASWLGFEVVREMKITEALKLGEQSNKVELQLWTTEAMICTKQQAPQAHITWFGVNDAKTYQDAKDQGAYAVFTDVPLLLYTLYTSKVDF